MRAVLIDVAVGIAIAIAIVTILFFASFDSTFIYRGF
jgi:hypothetical protein